MKMRYFFYSVVVRVKWLIYSNIFSSSSIWFKKYRFKKLVIIIVRFIFLVILCICVKKKKEIRKVGDILYLFLVRICYRVIWGYFEFLFFVNVEDCFWGKSLFEIFKF